MPLHSRRDRARREELDEFGDQIHSVELDADGKPCKVAFLILLRIVSE